MNEAIKDIIEKKDDDDNAWSTSLNTLLHIILIGLFLTKSREYASHHFKGVASNKVLLPK